MAGTYAEQAQLATLNAFIDLCKVALLKRAMELNSLNTKQAINTQQLIKSILNDAGGYASRMAWLVASGDNTISANAPELPKQEDLQPIVNSLALVFLA